MPLFNNILQVAGTAITALGTSLAIGASGAAASGALRVANGVSALSARNAAGTGDLSLVGVDAANNVTVGDTNAASILFGPASIGWKTGVVSPGLSQATAASGATPQNLTLTPQGPSASSTTAITNTPGSLMVSLAAPGANTVAGTEAFLQVNRGANAVAYLGIRSDSFAAGTLYLTGASGSAFAPGTTNWALLNTGGSLGVNGTTSVLIYNNGTALYLFNASGVQIGASTASFGGGVKVIGVTNATTIPTSLISSAAGLGLYANTGNLELNGGAYSFNSLVQSPAIQQPAAASGVTPTSLNITPQTFNAGSTTAVANTPGSVIVNLAVPGSLTNAGNEAQILVKRGAATVAALGPSGSSQTSLWLFASGTTPTASNPVLVNTGNIFLATTSTANIVLRPNGIGTSGPFILSQSGLQLGSETASFGGGIKVVGVSNATTLPNVLYSSGTGLVFYSNAGAFELNGGAYAFNTLVQSPAISQVAAATGVTPTNLFLTPQTFDAGSTTAVANTPGSVVVSLAAPGANTVAGKEASFQVQRAAGVLWRVGALVGSVALGALYGPVATPAANNYVLNASTTATMLNAVSNLYISVGNVTQGFVTNGNITFYNGSTVLAGGGVNVLGLGNATTVPTALIASGTGLLFYANAGAFETTATGFAFNALVQSPALTQVAAASGVTPTNLFITPQTFNAGSTTAATNTPGSLIVSLTAPGVNTVAGNEAYFQVQRAGNTVASLGAVVGTVGNSALYLSGATGSAFTPSSSNYALSGFGNATVLNGPGHVYFNINGATIHSYHSSGFQFGSVTAAFAGGVGVVGLSNATTIPNALVAGAAGVVVYANGGNFELDGGAYSFNSLVQSPAISQPAAASGITPTSLFLTPQTFNAGSSTAAANTPGSVVVSLAVPGANTVAGNEPVFQITRGGVSIGQIQKFAAYGCLNLMQAVPTLANANVISDGSSCYFNTGSGGSVYLAIGTSIKLTANASGLQLGTGSVIAGGGVQVLGIPNATTIPSSLIASGTGLGVYANAGNLELNGGAYAFNALVQSPNHSQPAPASGVVPTSMHITPQPANAASTTAATNTPGGVSIDLAVPNALTVAGNEAFLGITRGGSTVLWAGAMIGALTQGAIYAGTITPSASNYGINFQPAATVVNASAHVYGAIAGTLVTAMDGSGYTFFQGTGGPYGGGVKVLTIGNATTIPSALVSSATGLILYSNTGNLELNGGAFQFNALVQNPVITQVAAASGISPTSLWLTPQTFNAGSTTALTNTPGSVIVSLAAPGTNTVTGTEPYFQVQRAANTTFMVGPQIAAPAQMALWLTGNPGSAFTPTNTNYTVLVTGSQTYLNAGAHIYLGAAGNAVVEVFNANFFLFGGVAGGGVRVMGVANATTEPNAAPTGGSVWWSSLTVGACKQRTTSGWTKTTCGNTSTVKSTQLALDDEIPAFASITTSGNTMVVNVPLATSLSNVTLEFDVKVKIAVAGSGNAAGDAFSYRQIGVWKNVAGTLSLVGSLPAALVNVADASLAPCTVVITTSGTNIVITLTVTAASGTLGTADCTIRAKPLYN